ncbi:hypothetical protein L6250_03020 [Candidatus Parcubacteria bacterium]|nr:hypothetical protein [Candidatus Parcubacteria bacterium]
MRTSIKNLQEISGLHDLRTYTGAVRKSGKPDLPTTAILDLYMRRNEKDRLAKELKRLRRRKGQLQGRLQEVEKEMTKLLERATRKAMEIRGDSSKKKAGSSKKREKLVVHY